MTRYASLSPPARAELLEAARYYGGESSALRERFLAAFEAALDQLEAHPMAGSVLRGETRRLLFRGFPYSFIYGVRGAEIRIYAVMHHHRRPSYWEGRR
ncbi:MAG: type II toxin-antitoxin system RelE/ParE family toxin [Thermoanaerobaculia bacterium]